MRSTSANCRPISQARVQRALRVLEHHLAGPCPLAPRHRDQVLAGQQHLAGLRRADAGQHAPKRGLARATLTHQPQRLAGRQRHADAIDRLDRAPLAQRPGAADGEPCGQPRRVQQRSRGKPQAGGFLGLCRPERQAGRRRQAGGCGMRAARREAAAGLRRCRPPAGARVSAAGVRPGPAVAGSAAAPGCKGARGGPAPLRA